MTTATIGILLLLGINFFLVLIVWALARLEARLDQAYYFLVTNSKALQWRAVSQSPTQQSQSQSPDSAAGGANG